MKTTVLATRTDELNQTATPAAANRRRILLVEDHLVVSTGMTGLINYENDLQVCGTADDYASALQNIEKLKPDLVLLDITLKGRGGLELLKDIKARFPKQLVLVLSMHDESLYAARALRAGAAGYLMKQEATDTLLLAIRRVLDGDTYLSPRMEKQVMRRLLQQEPTTRSPLESLSDRELDIFRMIGQGKTTRQMSQLLFLSVKTIESHRAHIKEKLNLPTSMDLVKHAIRFEQECGARIDEAPAEPVVVSQPQPTA